MAKFLCMDVAFLEKNLKKLPLLPALLVYLAWGASMTGSSERMKCFAETGEFTPEPDWKEPSRAIA